MNAGDIIKIARKQSGLTQDELAEALNVNKSTIQKYENGMIQNLKLDTIRKLCVLFKMPSWYLIFPEIYKTEAHMKALNDEGVYLMRSFLQLSDEGRRRLMMYLEDMKQIEKYHNTDCVGFQINTQIIKEAQEHYQKRNKTP